MTFVDLLGIIWRIPGVRVTILCGVVAAVVLARPLARRFGRSPLLAGLTLTTWAVLLAVTLVPDLGQASRYASFELLRRTAWWNVQLCATGWDGAAGRALTTLDGQANVLLFAAPALFGTVWLRRPLVVAVALSVQSALIEVVQAVFAGTACQTSDWIANTLGGALGAATAAGVLASSRWRKAATAALEGSGASGPGAGR